MDKSKRIKFFYHDTRNEIENPKENHITKSHNSTEEQKRSCPLKLSKGDHDSKREGSTKQELSNHK